MAASAISGIVCIYRCGEAVSPITAAQAISETTVDSTEKIEFGYVHPHRTRRADQTAGQEVINMNPHVSRTMTEAGAPNLELNRKPDTGFSGLRYTLDVLFYFDSTVVGLTDVPTITDSKRQPVGISTLSKWMREKNNIRGQFPDGRFGIRNDLLPAFNVQPDSEKGLKFVSFEIRLNAEYINAYHGTIVLEMSGEADNIGN